MGKTAKGYIDQGQLLPDELIIDILASTRESCKESKGVIFDGFPRTIAQAEALKKMLAERGQEVSVMLLSLIHIYAALREESSVLLWLSRSYYNTNRIRFFIDFL